MADEDVKRKLTAILSADVQGYSRLMGDDEKATVEIIYHLIIDNLLEIYITNTIFIPLASFYIKIVKNHLIFYTEGRNVYHE